VTDWKSSFAPNVWHVRIDPDPDNGLTKPSAVDLLQLRGMDTKRFSHRLGEVAPDKMEEIVLAIAAVVELP
jgi:mRNA interferase MazF